MAIQYFSGLPTAATSSGNLAQTASSGGGANATVTLAAATSGAKFQRTVQSIAWSYSTTPPSSGYIRVFDGTSSGALVFQQEITASGPDGWPFFPAIRATPGRAITVVLTQAGISVIGYLQAYGGLL